MDTIFELLIFALFLLFPLLQRGLQKRKQQQTGASVPPLPHETEEYEAAQYETQPYETRDRTVQEPNARDAERGQSDEQTELDHALQEIRDLLGMPEPASRTEPQPAPKPAPQPERPVTIIRRPEPTPPPYEPEFRSPTSSTFQEEQFERLRTEPFESHDDHDRSEQEFEERAPYDEPFNEEKREAAKEKKREKKEADAYEERQESIQSRTRKQLLKRLRNPKGAREAIILSEILGPPKSMRSGGNER